MSDTIGFREYNHTGPVFQGPEWSGAVDATVFNETLTSFISRAHLGKHVYSYP